MEKKTKVGIVGINGIVGRELASEIKASDKYTLGTGYHRQSKYTLEKVFEDNDVVVEFASKEVIQELIWLSWKHKKPIFLCSSGWELKDYIGERNPGFYLVHHIVNSSWGNARFLDCVRRNICGDIDDPSPTKITIVDTHRKDKKDTPSGTSTLLRAKIKEALYMQGLKVKVVTESIRTGDACGGHEVIFDYGDMRVSIKEEVISRRIYAEGIISIMNRTELTGDAIFLAEQDRTF